MKKPKEVLCEIVFRDNKSGIVTSRIGGINKYQLIKFSTNSKDFIVFKESYNSPILKTDIQQIIIHRNDRRITTEKKDSIIIKSLNSQKTGEIS